MTVKNDVDNLRAVFFDKTQEAFSIFDKNLNFVDVNEAFLTILHLKKEQVIGKNLTEVSPGIEQTERYKLYLEVMQTGKVVMLDNVRVHPGLGDFASRVSIFKIGEGIGIAALDITDLKEAIEDFEIFIYKSSHDMRAPLASILGLINIAKIDLKESEMAKHYLGIIQQQVEKLERTTLRQIVETKQIRQKEKLNNFIDFQQIIDDVLKSLAYTKGFNDIRIEQNITAVQKFYSDESIIISLFQNIIDNAIKYKKENSADAFLKIDIEDEGDEIKITFADNGIGIPDNTQPDIFNKFYRATEKASGVGIGLYALKHYIRKLGGQIKLQSKEKVGTTFTIYLPNEKNGEQEK